MTTQVQAQVRGERGGAALRRRALGAATFAGQALPGFLLSFTQLLGIPSGLYAAYIAALAADGRPVLPSLAGCAAALAMRLVWGLAPRWDALMTLALLLPAPSVLPRRSNGWLIIWTAMALCPGLIWQAASGTQADILYGVGSLCVGALASPVMLRAVRSLCGGQPIAGMEERIAVGFLAACLCSGGGRMLVAGVNLGVFCVCAAAVCMALYLSLAPAVVTGLAGGLALTLAGLPAELGMCLAVGGFLAGMVQMVEKRWLVCAAFGTGCGLMLLVSGCGGTGAMAAAIAAPILLAVLPERLMAWPRRFFRRLTYAPPAGSDAFAAAALGQWERAMDAMARAVPSPVPDDGPRTAGWWRAHLCAACPDGASCEAISSAYASARVEEVWQARDCPEDDWATSLEKLRGLGCGRLYCLREGMERLRDEEPERRAAFRRACYQRDMLVTHLSAMSGAARRFAELSGGERGWEEARARRLRRLLDEAALPVRLTYLRRVEGHVCAAVEADSAAHMKRHAEELTRLVAEVTGAPMSVERAEGKRLTLCQTPPLCAVFGVAQRSAGDGQPSGDSAWLGSLPRGVFLAAVSDGMGQGERAGQESANTVALLRLCMEAGYDRAQTLTAVNGMMLLETGGERFATVDLFCADLWTGQASLDKLGAAGSWLRRGGTLVELTGDALPLGILETVASRTSTLRLRDGDRLLLMTDGIEDAFQDKEALRRAVEAALALPSPQHAAETLVDSADRACLGARRDDMTAAVIHIRTAPGA